MTSAIIASFDGASRSYDGAADIQSIVAEHMLADVAQFAPRSILDIGCGTGLLTALAHQRWPKAAITAVDASPAMLDMARAKVPSARFVRADAAKLDLGERFDLVLSSMVLHWLSEPQKVFAQWQRLAAANGMLRVALPVADSLAEWKRFCGQHGVASRLWRFPDRPVFDAPGPTRQHTLVYASAREFLHSMKRTGAAISDPNSAGTAPVVLRKLLRHAPKPFPATFAIAYLRMP